MIECYVIVWFDVVRLYVCLWDGELIVIDIQVCCEFYVCFGLVEVVVCGIGGCVVDDCFWVFQEVVLD